MARVTQKTIAAKLGLSPSLVSRALSGKAGSIGSSAETTERIIQTAHDLGYVPSAAARQLRGEGGPVIGVVVADIGDPFFAQAMSEVVRQTHQRGYALAVAGFDRRIIDRRDVSVLLEQNLAGLLIIGGGPVGWMESIAGRNVTTVRIGSIQPSATFHQIGPDETDGYQKLIRHLGSFGHRHLGFAGADHIVHRERLKLARVIARREGMTCPVRHLAIGSDHVLKAGLEGGLKLIEQSKSKLPTAIICSSDTVAMGVMSVLSERGIRVPDQVSVTGFDDVMLSQLTAPPLTTLHQPVADMIRLALDMIIAGKREAKIVRLPLKLILRASTAHTLATHSGLGTSRATKNRTRQIIVMGVSGCGKSTVGKALAKKLKWRYIEGDNFHSEANIRKMSSRIPLTDEDRWPWLDALREEMNTAASDGLSVVLSCSALRQVYRDRLTEGLHDAHFMYLQGDRESLMRNMKKRRGHFMKADMLDSQLRTLEEPEDAWVFSCQGSIDEIVETARKKIHEQK